MHHQQNGKQYIMIEIYSTSDVYYTKLLPIHFKLFHFY